MLVLGEIRQVIERIQRRDPAQARALEKWLRKISPEFQDRGLPVDEAVADEWGRLAARQPIPVLDGLLAATALVHGLTVASRDEAGFRHAGVPVLNPFSQPGRPKGLN